MVESHSPAFPLGAAPITGLESGRRLRTADPLWQRRSIEGVGPFQQGKADFGAGPTDDRGRPFCGAIGAAHAARTGCRSGAGDFPNPAVEGMAVSWEDGSPIPERDPDMSYRAPINDMLLALNHGAGLQAAVQAGHYGDFDGDITAAVLEEAGKFASDVLAPLNRIGDQNGIKLDGGKVTTAPGWPDAYQRWTAAGWNAVSGPEAFGGQDLPLAINAACPESRSAADMAVGRCTLLTLGRDGAPAGAGVAEVRGRRWAGSPSRGGAGCVRAGPAMWRSTQL